MSQTAITAEHNNSGTKEIWRTFWILLILTIVELALGFWMMGMPVGGLRLSVKGAIVILMLSKAFYIVAYFMHLKHELKNLIMTIVVPLLLFVWFILAFLYDGNSYKNLKLENNSYYNEQSKTKVEKKETKNATSEPAKH